MNRRKGTRKVIIINQGGPGDITREDYDFFCDMLKGWIESFTQTTSVVVVESSDDALKEVGRYSDGQNPILVFTSASMLGKARRIKEENRWLHVLVLTGQIPNDEVVILDKGWVTLDLFKAIVFETWPPW